MSYNISPHQASTKYLSVTFSRFLLILYHYPTISPALYAHFTVYDMTDGLTLSTLLTSITISHPFTKILLHYTQQWLVDLPPIHTPTYNLPVIWLADRLLEHWQVDLTCNHRALRQFCYLITLMFTCFSVT